MFPHSFLRQAASGACLFLFAAISAVPLAAQSRHHRPNPEYLQLGKPDQEKGRRILQTFRERGMYAGDNYFEFELRVMPRRGEERTVPGRMWTGEKDGKPVFRFVTHPGVAGHEHRMLVHNAVDGDVWMWVAGREPAVQRLPVSAHFDGVGGTDVAAFDLQMGYLYWPEFVYEGVSKVRGRPADTFLLYPPEAVQGGMAGLAGVRVYLDSQYGAPVDAEYIGLDGKVLKKVSIVDLKRVEDQWIVKSIDFRDEKTRNKTRFSLTGAAVGLDTASTLFDPEMLAESLRGPEPGRIHRIAP